MEQEPQEDEDKVVLNPKKRYWKFVLNFFAVIIGVFILYIAAFWAVRYYEAWQGQRAVQKLAEALKKETEENYNRAMADTYGGKTPQETLRMYIEAVEKGDYELASKYFVLENKEKELESLKNASKENIDNYVNRLKTESLNAGGDFSPDKKYFSFKGKLLVSMILYPNGIWKIIEI